MLSTVAVIIFSIASFFLGAIVAKNARNKKQKAYAPELERLNFPLLNMTVNVKADKELSILGYALIGCLVALGAENVEGERQCDFTICLISGEGQNSHRFIVQFFQDKNVIGSGAGTHQTTAGYLASHFVDCVNTRQSVEKAKVLYSNRLALAEREKEEIERAFEEYRQSVGVDLTEVTHLTS